ncbi:MAG: hypothetical protein HYV06_04650 [Deltaproteobacteria bacterium]|nr:hypothetical protein [Deltaproteobacteria bacterium]
MARADILFNIVKSAIGNDNLSLRKAVEALAADERSINLKKAFNRRWTQINADRSEVRAFQECECLVQGKVQKMS